jgi:hypothetical protein
MSSKAAAASPLVVAAMLSAVSDPPLDCYEGDNNEVIQAVVKSCRVALSRFKL